MKLGCSVPAALRLFLPHETPEETAACVTHDLAYSNGGTRRQRALADARLLLGLLEAGMAVDRAHQYHAAVRLCGKPHWGPRGVYVEDEPAD